MEKLIISREGVPNFVKFLLVLQKNVKKIKYPRDYV